MMIIIDLGLLSPFSAWDELEPWMKTISKKPTDKLHESGTKASSEVTSAKQRWQNVGYYTRMSLKLGQRL